MHRPVAATIASGIVTLLLYPLDTLHISRQFSSKFPAFPYAGWRINLIATCLKTNIYFTTYESLIYDTSPAIASCASVITSGITTPLSVMKKRVQSKKNKWGKPQKIRPATFIDAYTLGLVRQMPKDVIKYSIYEPVLSIAADRFNMLISGAIAAAFASTISNLITIPVEVMRIRAALGLVWLPHIIVRDLGWDVFFRGFHIPIISSFLANVIGHAILESLSSRK